MKHSSNTGRKLIRCWDGFGHVLLSQHGVSTCTRPLGLVPRVCRVDGTEQASFRCSGGQAIGTWGSGSKAGSRESKRCYRCSSLAISHAGTDSKP